MEHPVPAAPPPAIQLYLPIAAIQPHLHPLRPHPNNPKLHNKELAEPDRTGTVPANATRT